MGKLRFNLPTLTPHSKYHLYTSLHFSLCFCILSSPLVPICLPAIRTVCTHCRRCAQGFSR